MTAAERRDKQIQRACYRLVKSPHWADLKEIAEEFATTNSAPPPMMAGLLCGYFVGCIIKDGLGQFLAFIERAAMAPDQQEDENQ